MNTRWKKNLVLVILFLVLMSVLMFMRAKDSRLQRKETENNLLLWVTLVKAKASKAYNTIILPGTLAAWHEAPIFARTNGYVKTWMVDIGARVKAGDLLAQIETPELDAQLCQAEADLKEAIAQNKLAQTTAARWINLRKTDSVSQQALDEKVDTAAAALARLASRMANRDRLRQLVEFERVIAPFDGIISDRRTDIGSLINLGSKPSQQQPLFRMVQLNPLRLYIKIPQTYSSRIQANMKVKLQFAEHPGQEFSARLLETANAIEPITRTLLAQFIVDNKAGLLLPGAYTKVSLIIPSYYQSVRLPVNTLIFRKEGLQVAGLSKDKRVILKNIKINKDFGNEVDVASGIKPQESIIINPPDSLFEGQEVRLASKGIE